MAHKARTKWDPHGEDPMLILIYIIESLRMQFSMNYVYFVYCVYEVLLSYYQLAKV